MIWPVFISLYQVFGPASFLKTLTSLLMCVSVVLLLSGEITMAICASF